MAKKTLFQLRAGAFTCGVFPYYSWGKQVFRIILRKAIGNSGYQEFTFSNSKELEDLLALLRAAKKDLVGVFR